MFSRKLFSFHSLVLVIILFYSVTGEDTKLPGDVGNEEKVPKNPRVKISDGELKGRVLSSLSGRPIFTFLGIPYAKPPVGDLRFTHPRRPDKWSGVRDATKDRAICAQLLYPERTFDGDEDCLYINVFTTMLPEDEEMDVAKLHDVVVIIHDGLFSYNSGNLNAYMPDHLLDHDIVMVSFNYRLGVLGFLSTGDEWSPGNYGLKDQVQALDWVHNNIEKFGGNPKSVTLLGFQAGGSSAHLHMLAPLLIEKFHKVISLSGTALSPWAIVDSELAVTRAKKLGKLLKCKKKDIENTKALVSCLRKKYTLDLVTDAQKVMIYGTEYSYPFVPVIEPRLPNMRPLLPQHPLELMLKTMKGPEGKWEKPWLVGMTSEEALPQALQAMIFPYIMTNLNENPKKYVPHVMELELPDKERSDLIGEKLWNFYVGKNETLAYGNLGQLAEILSDYNVYHSVLKSIRVQSAVSEAPIYVYKFSYDRRDMVSLGVPQGEDVEYMFPNVIASKKREYRDYEQTAIKRLITVISNFVKYGNPAPKGSDLLGGEEWPQAKGDKFKFVDIGKEITIEDDFYTERMKLWDIIDRIINEGMLKNHDEL